MPNEQINTGGGASVGNVNTNGGPFAGRDAPTINNDNAPQFDIEIKAGDNASILLYLTQFNIRLAFAESEIRALQRGQLPVAHSGPSDSVVRIFAVVFSILAIVAFIIVIAAAWKGLTGG